MSVLIDVPSSVGRSILTEWLRAKSMAQLDVAYCGGSERKPFLDLLSGSIALEVDSDFSGPLNCVDRLRWVTARNVKCHSFTFYGDDLSAAAIPVFSEFFKNTAVTLKVVKIDSDDTGLMLLLGHIATNRCSLRILDANNTDAPDVVRMHVDDALAGIVRNSAGDLRKLHLCQVGSKSCFASDIQCPALCKVDVKIRCDQDLIDLCRAAPNLKELDLPWPTCTAVGISAIGQHCHQLEKFFCTGGSISDEADFDVGIKAIAIGCRKLKVIELDNCAELTDIGLTAIATHCTQLEEFMISENENVSDEPLIALVHSVNAGALRNISLQNCPCVSGTGIVALATHCHLLHTLSLRDLVFEDPSYLNSAIVVLKQVKNLDLFDFAIDDDLLQLIAEHMPLLEELNIDTLNQPLFTSDGLMHIALKCSQLKCLTICDGILSPMEVALWQTLRPGIDIDIDP